MWVLGLLHQRMLNAYQTLYGGEALVCTPLLAATTLTSSTVLGCFAAIERYYTELSSAGNQYDAFTNTATLDSDFDIEVDILNTSTSSMVILGDSTTGDNLLYTDSNALKIRIAAGSFVTIASGTISDGRLHRIRVTRISGIVTGYIDGVAGTPAAISGSFLINAQGQRGNGLYWDGILANLKITKAGTLIVDAKKDGDGTSNIIVNDAATLGAELSSGIFIDIDTTDAFTDFDVTTGLSAGLSYFVVMTIESISSGRMKINTATTDSVKITEPSTTEITATGTTFSSIQTGASGFTGRVKLSTREIPAATPYLTRVNQTSADVELYTQVSDGWEGEELWTYGDAVSNGAEGAGQLIAGSTSDPNVVTGNVYRYGAAVAGLTGGEIRYQLGASDIVVTSADGNFQGEHTVTSNDNNYVRVGGSQCNAGATMTVSTKRFLEVA